MVTPPATPTVALVARLRSCHMWTACTLSQMAAQRMHFTHLSASRTSGNVSSQRLGTRCFSKGTSRMFRSCESCWSWQLPLRTQLVQFTLCWESRSSTFILRAARTRGEFGPHDHVLGHPVVAGGREAVGPLDLDHAHAAGADLVDAPQVAQRRYADAVGAGGLQDGGPLLRQDPACRRW